MDLRKHSNARINSLIRRLVAAGNMAAFVASDPARFSAEDRSKVVEAWNITLESLRQLDIEGEKP